MNKQWKEKASTIYDLEPRCLKYLTFYIVNCCLEFNTINCNSCLIATFHDGQCTLRSHIMEKLR